MYPFSPPARYKFQGKVGTLAQHLGYDDGSRLLIINADDFGLSEGINNSIEKLWARQRITSSTIMVPAPAYQSAREILKRAAGLRCGVHLTLTSDSDFGTILPLTNPELIPSIVGRENAFHLGREEYFKHADPAHAEREAAAQLEKALVDGIDITHLDSHEGTLQLMPQFAEVYLKLAAKYRLPIRMGSKALLIQLGFDAVWIEKARALDIQFPDNLIYLPMSRFGSRAEKESYLIILLENLPTGVTEIYFHPCLSSTEVNEEANDLEPRVWDYQILEFGRFHEQIMDAGIKLIDFKELRDLMRQS